MNTTPTTKLVATNADGKTFDVVAVNGGWTTVRDTDGREFKVRNGSIVTAPVTWVVAKPAAVEAPAKAAKAPRTKLPLELRKNGVVDSLYLRFYKSYSVECNDGSVRRSIDNGDEVASYLRVRTLEEVYKHVAAIVGLSVGDLRNRFEHLNVGMQRMNLGNMLRRFLKGAKAA